MTEKQFIRYVKANEKLDTSGGCNDCNSKDCDCRCSLEQFKEGRLFAEDFVEAVNTWCEKHPRKTYMEDFFAKFPNADRCKDGAPACCRRGLYGGDINCEGVHCKDCWYEEMDDE